jgi:FK506-binding protein 1
MSKSILLVSLIIITLSISIKADKKDDEFNKLYQVQVLKEGDNTNYPDTGDKVTVHYTGTFPDTGKKFDSSLDRNTPFTFTLKRGQVIKCWDEVVSRMSKGEKIKVVCPSRLAYGSRGAGGAIPPDTDIAFEIELLSFGKNGEL